MSTADNAGVKLGPQPKSESTLARRLRLHQCWYRLNVLGLERWGQTPPPASVPLGSILHDEDAAKNLNFTTPAASDLYRRRRLQGWGVDPVRCTKYLTSSQAMTLNIVGLLTKDPDWAARVLSVLTGDDDVIGLQGYAVEFAPPRRSEHLNDMTRIDSLFRLQTPQGIRTVAVEFKYADRFNSRYLDLAEREPYERIANASGLWDTGSRAFQSRTVNQAIRCHALAASFHASHPNASNEPAQLLVIHHSGDKNARNMASAYSDLLLLPGTFQNRTLDEMLGVMSSVAPLSQLGREADDLAVRYLPREPVASNTGTSATRKPEWSVH